MRELKREGVYADQLTEEYISDVINSAPLHDIGKIKVSDLILNKPGRLTDEEFAVMKTHTIEGAHVIEHAMKMVSEEDSPYLKEADNLAMYHHEKWNGSGYPVGLKGEAIPLSARIMAVADVFDALVSKRSYKDGLSYEKAMEIIDGLVDGFVALGDTARTGAGHAHAEALLKLQIRHEPRHEAGDKVREVMNANMDI